MITLQVNEYSSSTVLASSYDFSNGTLDILFENGPYRYLAVPADVYEQFATADSQGAALNQYIKGGRFETIKMPKEESAEVDSTDEAQ